MKILNYKYIKAFYIIPKLNASYSFLPLEPFSDKNLSFWGIFESRFLFLVYPTPIAFLMSSSKLSFSLQLRNQCPITRFSFSLTNKVFKVLFAVFYR